MSIFDKPPEGWSEDDLEELLGPLPQRETPTLEFKGGLALATNGEKKEAEKDVEGLANAGGGTLIYGVSETALPDGSRVAGGLTPVDGSLAEQLNNVLDGRGEPRIPFDLHVITAAAGGIYIPVIVYGHRRPHMHSNGSYYLRRNLQVRRMTEAEVAEAYRDKLIRDRRATEGLVIDPGVEQAHAALAEVEQRVHRGLSEAELALYREQTGEATPPGWLSVVTHPVPLQPNLLNPAQFDPNTFRTIAMDDRWREIEPPLRHFSFHRTQHGFVSQLPDRDDVVPSYLVRLWRDGVFEFGDLLEPPAQMRTTRDENRVIPTHAIAQYVHDFLVLFARIYALVGYDGVVRASARLDDVAGYRLGVDTARAGWDELAPLDDNEVVADPWQGAAQELEGAAQMIAMDLSERLFLAAGGTRPYFFDEEGNYTG